MDNIVGKLSDFSEEHPDVVAAGIVAVLAGSAFVGLQLNNRGAVLGGPAQKDTPSPQSTADAFPEPGATITAVKKIKGADGSTSTATVLAYVTGSPGGTPQLVRETIRETGAGVRVTSTATATSVITLPGGTSVRVETVVGPGSTSIETVEGPGATSTETVTVPGPQTTVTTTATETVPGPEVTVTVSAAPDPSSPAP